MKFTTATNPSTGENIVQIDGQWVPYEKSATGEGGRNAYMVNGEWVVEPEDAPKGPVVEATTPSQAQEAVNFLGGAGSTSRGAASIVAKLFNKELPDWQIAGVPVDPSSGYFTAGSALADPVGMGVGSLAVKGAKAIPILSKTPVGQGIVGGSLGGGIVGGLNPTGDPVTNSLLGFGMGGLVGGAVPAAAGAFGAAADKFAGRTGGDVRAGRILRRSVEEGDIISADPSLRTAQATNPGREPSAGLSALDVEFKKYGGNAAYRKQVAQENARRTALGGYAGGTNAEEVMANAEVAKQILNDELDPMRVTGSENANMWTREIVELKKQADEARKAAEKAVANVRVADRGYSAGQAVFRQRNPWVSNPPGKYTYLGELGERVQDSEAGKSLAAGEAARLAEYKLERTAAHGIQELSVAPILTKIDTMLSTKGERTNDVREKVLKAFKGRVARFMDENGNIDAYDLHGLRKNANDLIDELFRGADDSIKNRAVAALADVKTTIDNGLKASGGDALVRYFDKYAEGMNKIRQQELVGKIMDLSDKKLINLSQGGDPKTIEKVLGQGKYKLSDIGEAATTVRKIGEQLKRERDIGKAAEFASGTLTKIITEESPKFPRVNLLNRAVQTTNTVATSILEKLDEATINALSKAAHNPVEAIRLMNTLPLVEQEKAYLLRWMRDAGKVGAISAGATGGVTK